MMLPDVNVLIYAHREASALHSGCLNWLENLLNGDESYGLSEFVLSGFLRITTHPKIFIKPTPLTDAIGAS